MRHYAFTAISTGPARAAGRRHSAGRRLDGRRRRGAPWRNDYHNDLNAELMYIAYRPPATSRKAPATSTCSGISRRPFAPSPGIFTARRVGGPGVMSLAGQPLAAGAILDVAHDDLLDRALVLPALALHGRRRLPSHPRLSLVQGGGECLKALLKPDVNGILKLQRSTSPEIFDNTERAWLIPNSNYDLMSMKMQFLALAEMAAALGKAEEAKAWQQTAQALGKFHVDGQGVLLLDEKTPLPASHRHLSNLIGLVSLQLDHLRGRRGGSPGHSGVAQAVGPPGNQRLVRFHLGLDELPAGPRRRRRIGPAGPRRFRPCLCPPQRLPRHRRPDDAGLLGMAHLPVHAGRNFLGMQAAQEMLLQSWSPTPGVRDAEVIRIFPATPWRWHDASFTDLRAEGGSRVSARRENNATTWFRIVAAKDGQLRVRDNFGPREPLWTEPGVKKGRRELRNCAERKGRRLKPCWRSRRRASRAGEGGGAGEGEERRHNRGLLSWHRSHITSRAVIF